MQNGRVQKRFENQIQCDLGPSPWGAATSGGKIPGTVARVFASLKDINVRMVSQGASLLNISLVVAAGDLHRAVESLHREFFDA